MPVMVLLALLAQFLSGAAAIVNQTVWQRSLVAYLAGNEAASSMIVVLVFMAGVGAGALWTGRTADRVRNPARTLGQVELVLALANLLVLGLLSLDLSETLQGLQRLTFALGIPLRLTYGVVSAVTLLGPCFLMGVTAPLMSEVAQRQLGRRDNRFLVVLFFVNTLGAFGGAWPRAAPSCPSSARRAAWFWPSPSTPRPASWSWACRFCRRGRLPPPRRRPAHGSRGLKAVTPWPLPSGSLPSPTRCTCTGRWS